MPFGARGLVVYLLGRSWFWRKIIGHPPDSMYILKTRRQADGGQTKMRKPGIVSFPWLAYQTAAHVLIPLVGRATTLSPPLRCATLSILSRALPVVSGAARPKPRTIPACSTSSIRL